MDIRDTLVSALNPVDPLHLAHVTARMRDQGAPRIRITWSETLQMHVGLEGSHRMAAAAALGIVPRFAVISWHALIDHASIGYGSARFWGYRWPRAGMVVANIIAAGMHAAAMPETGLYRYTADPAPAFRPARATLIAVGPDAMPIASAAAG